MTKKEWNSNTTLVKVKLITAISYYSEKVYSNTTLVKVKWFSLNNLPCSVMYSNTTLVKVKLTGRLSSKINQVTFKYNTC